MTNARLFSNALLATTILTTTLSFPTPLPSLDRPAAMTRADNTIRRTNSAARKSRTGAPRRAAVGPVFTVTATAYQAVPGQTDNEPFVTADNSLIKPHYGSRKRWLALSNDLLKRWGGHFDYGDKVRVRGLSPQLDGIYTVHDTMNRRHRRSMDVLTHPSEKIDLFTKGVTIQKVVL